MNGDRWIYLVWIGLVVGFLGICGVLLYYGVLWYALGGMVFIMLLLFASATRGVESADDRMRSDPGDDPPRSIP